jgi:hypothetical protein
VSYNGSVNTDVVFVAEPKEFLSCELCAVVGDNGVQNPKSMDNVVEEEHELLGFDLGDQPRFYPFEELVNGNKHVNVSLGHLLEGPNQVKPRDREWQRDGDRLECLGWQMGMPSILLAPFASAQYVRGISHGG